MKAILIIALVSLLTACDFAASNAKLYDALYKKEKACIDANMVYDSYNDECRLKP